MAGHVSTGDEEGLAVGNNVGVCDGLDVSGLLLGDTVGSDVVGLEVTGDWDGLDDSGLWLGDTVGSDVGLRLGDLDGVKDGEREGCVKLRHERGDRVVREEERTTVLIIKSSIQLTFFVGSSVGLNVGFDDDDGLSVGFKVGSSVGFAVGLSVPH